MEKTAYHQSDKLYLRSFEVCLIKFVPKSVINHLKIPKTEGILNQGLS